MPEQPAQFTYPAPRAAWQQAEFSSTTLTAITVAILTTLISYQLTALTSDIVLGWKPRRIARIHTFQTLLLSRKATPIAVLNALFRTDLLTRFYFQGNLPAHSPIQRDAETIKPNTVFLLLTLLFTAPIVNILAVITTIEQKELVTFRDAHVPPVIFGIWNETGHQLRLQRFSDVCGAVPVKSHSHDTPLSRFLVCAHTFRAAQPHKGLFPPDELPSLGSFSVTSKNNFSLELQVQIGTWYIESHLEGYLRKEGGNFILRMSTTRADAERLAIRGMNMILEVCRNDMDVDDVPRKSEGINLNEGEEFVIGLGNVPCHVNANRTGAITESIRRVIRTVTEEYITLRDAERMDIATTGFFSNDTLEFQDGTNQIFALRRTRLVGIPVMAIIALLMVIARLVVVFLFNNDVNDGIERLLKERIGIPHCVSLLQYEGKVVSYNARKGESGGLKQNPMRSYGAGRSFLPGIIPRSAGTSQSTLALFKNISDTGSTNESMDIDQIDYISRETDPDPV